MNCEHAFELISASLDGELTAAEEAQLQGHLAQCPACRALREELSGLHETTQAALEAVAPPELKAAILENLPAQKKPAGKVVYWKHWGAMAAAVALVALAAWQLPRFVFDSVDVAPAADKSAAEVTTEAAADDAADTNEATGALPESPAVVFSDTMDAPDAGVVPDVDAIPDAGATYGSFPSKKESGSTPPAPSPAPVSGTAAPASNAVITNTAAPRAQSEDKMESYVAAQSESAQADGATGGTNDLEAPMVLFTSGDAPSVSPGFAYSTETDETPDEALPADRSGDAQPTPQSAPVGGAGGGGGSASQSAPESGTADALTIESRMAKLDTAPAPECWCGVLTLAEYEPAVDYPLEVLENGQRQYTLPADDFHALIETLDSGGAAYELRTEGEDIVPDAPSGLVVVTGQTE